ncbi:hypothetical protein [Massilia alkalitolerans]|uniref:hypothetical protein n=1 Tax=Massilia alkalitolerans TaxID=286638 RepID=UPI0028AFA85D|nr:hypothetical protein [Massilia alkalitolerans]
MKMTRLFAAAFVALLLCASHARAADPEERFLLTPALLAKMKAAGPELKKLDKEDEEEQDDGKSNNLSAEEFARVLDKEPRARAILARHGMSTREFALTSYAMLHAGMFVGLEPTMNKKQAAEMLAKFTKEQRANVELLRKTDLKTFSQ